MSLEHSEDGSNALSIILLVASMISLVVTVIGIKLKWFRHRLTFKQPEDQGAIPVLLKTTSVTEIRENCAGGVFRSFDEESLIVREEPVTNGNSRPKSSSECFSIMFLIKITHNLHTSFFYASAINFLSKSYQKFRL